MQKQVNKLDMGWGSPDFLHSYWKNQFWPFYIKPPTLSYTYGGINDLKTVIKQLHKQQKNAVTDKKYIIIGNGAGQVIQALLYALRSKDIYFVNADTPYFPRFKFYSSLAGMSFWDQKYAKDLVPLDTVQLITIPNNPDNSCKYNRRFETAIYDLTYNWPTYTIPKNYNEDLMVFTLSKCSGHASARIGWAIVKDKQLAKLAEKYIEYSTGGVSIYSQIEAYDVISYIMKDNVFFECGKQVLKYRWSTLLTLKLPFKILNKNGQFAWCKGKKPNNIEALMGSKFGMTDEYFRLNMGVSEETFNEFINLYKN